MADANKEYKLRITGDAREFGATTRQVTSQLNEVKREAMNLASSLTGGLIGGGIGGAVAFAVGLIGTKIREAAALLDKAERADISVKSAARVNEFERALATPESIYGAQETVRRQRSNALEVGSPEAIKAFERLGLALKDIEKLKPDELFYRVASALPKDATREQRIAFRTLVGERNGEALEGFAAGGVFRDRQRAEKIFEALKLNPLFGLGNSAVERAFRRKYKADFEPLPDFGRGDENRASILEENNRQRESQVNRERLSAAQQLLEIDKERARLSGLINSDTNPVRRQQLKGQLIDLESQKNGIINALAGSQRKASALEPDQYTRIGLLNFGAGDSANLGREQLSTLKSLQRDIRRLPVDTANALRAAL